MHVRDGMSSVVLTIGPGHSLSDAARLMTERNVGAAIVVDPDSPGPGIITERDILRSVAAGENPTTEKVADHLTDDLISCVVTTGASSRPPTRCSTAASATCWS